MLVNQKVSGNSVDWHRHNILPGGEDLQTSHRDHEDSGYKHQGTDGHEHDYKHQVVVHREPKGIRQTSRERYS